MRRQKSDIITFKASEGLVEALSRVPNRSEFIRSALLAALENTCPLCQGAGFLSPQQRNHLTEFMGDHQIEECTDCHEVHLVCKHHHDEE